MYVIIYDRRKVDKSSMSGFSARYNTSKSALQNNPNNTCTCYRVVKLFQQQNKNQNSM